MRRTFYAALNRAGLGHKRYETPPLRFHDLRHTFGTLGAQCWRLRDLQASMGHASIQTTEIYAHHVPKTNAANALTALVSGAESGASLVPSSNGHQVPAEQKAS